MAFLREHFDHFVLAGLAVASAAAGIWCDIHRLNDASKWLYGQSGGLLGALMLRMNAQKHVEPPAVPNDPPLPSRAKSD